MNKGEIGFKNSDVVDGLNNVEVHPMLNEIIDWAVRKYGIMITETSRKSRHPNDLHGLNPLRAMDLRTWCYAPGIASTIAREINNRWQYDPTRPDRHCALIHDSGQGIHFHIQVHPRTVKI